MHKYRAVPTTVDGVRFASKAEAARYSELKILVRTRAITALVLQPRFPLVVNGQKIADYIADFEYLDTETGRRVVEDVKGIRLPLYNLKKRLMKAIHGIEIVEVGQQRKRRIKK